MNTIRKREILAGVLLASGLLFASYQFWITASKDSGSIDTLGDGSNTGELSDLESSEENEDPFWTEISRQDAFKIDENGHAQGYLPIYSPLKQFVAAVQERYDHHGLVRAGAIIIRAKPDSKSLRLGLLREGTRVRVQGNRTFGGGCRGGWYKLFPTGWLCSSAGLKVEASAPQWKGPSMAPLGLENPIPLDYRRVKDEATPFFHRLPSYREQEQADIAGQAWFRKRGRAPMALEPKKRPRDVPPIVRQYQNSGYYVTVAEEVVKSKRYFVRTNRGTFARKYQIESTRASPFQGVVLPGGEQSLPKYWIVRELELQEPGPNPGRLVNTGIVPQRKSLYPFVERVRIGDYNYYQDADGRVIRSYAVGVARKVRRPPGVAAKENWIHVDLSEQVLVAYIGDRPVYTTLVSTGKEPGMTPVGVFRLQSKFIVTSMRDQPVEDEAYSIEDVPWTQYFSQNIALHTAFWHGAFGLVRSHGCVNLAPADARWLFGFTEPALPENWLAVMPGHGGIGKGSAVVITE